MKVDMGGTPIFVSARQRDKGATITQGSSRIRMNEEQAQAVLAAMHNILMPSGQRAEKCDCDNLG